MKQINKKKKNYLTDQGGDTKIKKITPLCRKFLVKLDE